MFIHIDLNNVPPSIRVRDPDDFQGFKVVIDVARHTWIAPEVVTQLAGRKDDEEWKARLSTMLDFAASRGWLDDAGRIRAHVEVPPSSTPLDRRSAPRAETDVSDHR